MTRDSSHPETELSQGFSILNRTGVGATQRGIPTVQLDDHPTRESGRAYGLHHHREIDNTPPDFTERRALPFHQTAVLPGSGGDLFARVFEVEEAQP